jgi:predicted ATP-grasp superfamily ATP-dependent carboligase
VVHWASGPPGLDQPVVIAAFEGWNDAGNAASDALRFLIRTLDATEVGEVEPDEFVDYQASRPHVEIVGGVARTIVWPRTRVLAAPESDVLLVLGNEPSFRWREYSSRLADAALALDSRLVITLGALLGDTPHTRPMRVTGTASDDDLVRALSLQRSRYEGPTGIVGTLHTSCRETGLPSVSLWVPVPHYVATPPSPKATVALVDRVRSLLGLTVDTGRLEIAASAWERQVDAVIRKDDETSEYVRALEEQYDEQPDDADLALEDSDDALPSGDALAAEFQRYLRERDDGE